MYHKVHPNSPTIWWVTVNNFYRQMCELKNKDVVYLDDYDNKNPRHVVITFDGVYNNVCEFALPILKHFNYPFELFITSDYIGNDNQFDTVEPNTLFATKEDLTDLVNGGARLQWHSKSHPNLKLVNETKRIIEELSIPESLLPLDPKGFKWFAYPYGEYNELTLKEVRKRFSGALSCNQGNEIDKHLLNRVTVLNDTSLKENKITCIIASYNYGQYLIEAIESVLRQTTPPDEILITDDGSIDDTQSIAEAYVKKYPKLIRYNRNEKNLGIVAHFNKAISLTKAEYIIILGADNRLMSNYIEESVKTLEQNENTAVAYTDFVLFGNRAKIVYMTDFAEHDGKVINNDFFQITFPVFKTSKDMLKNISDNNFIHGSSMFRRAAFEKVGGYIKTDIPEDHFLFKRMIEAGYDAQKVYNTNLEYRQHSIEQANNLVNIYNQLNLYKKLYSEKNAFEKSKFYSISYLLFKAKHMPKRTLLKRLIKKIFK